MMPYHSSATFLGVEQTHGGLFTSDPTYRIIGIPWDHGVTNRPGARLGPKAIRDASLMLTTEEHPTIGISIKDNILDSGDHQGSMSGTELIEDLAKMTTWCLGTTAFPVFLGGDHTITQGFLAGASQFFEQPLNVIHFDAHNDTWGMLMGTKIHHGAWLRNNVEANEVYPDGNIQLGLRSNSNLDASMFLKPDQNIIRSARDLMKLDATRCALELAQHIEVQNRKFWFTFDIDCLDPAYAPGTGTPEVGGLSTIWVLEFIEALVLRAGHKIVGMDLVEVCPAYDISQITALAGATVIHTFIASHLKNAKENSPND